MFPNTREQATKLLDIVTKRSPDSEIGKSKTSLDVLAQGYRTTIIKLPKTATPDIDLNGIAEFMPELNEANKKSKKPATTGRSSSGRFGSTRQSGERAEG